MRTSGSAGKPLKTVGESPDPHCSEYSVRTMSEPQDVPFLNGSGPGRGKEGPECLLWKCIVHTLARACRHTPG